MELSQWDYYATGNVTAGLFPTILQVSNIVTAAGLFPTKFPTYCSICLEQYCDHKANASFYCHPLLYGICLAALIGQGAQTNRTPGSWWRGYCFMKSFLFIGMNFHNVIDIISVMVDSVLIESLLANWMLLSQFQLYIDILVEDCSNSIALSHRYCPSKTESLWWETNNWQKII